MSNPYDTNHFQALYNAGALPQIRTAAPQVIHTHSIQTVVKEVPAYSPPEPVAFDHEGLARILDPLAGLKQQYEDKRRYIGMSREDVYAAWQLNYTYNVFLTNKLPAWAESKRFSNRPTVEGIQKAFDSIGEAVKAIEQSDNPVAVGQQWASFRDKPKFAIDNFGPTRESRLQALTAAVNSMKALDRLSHLDPLPNLNSPSLTRENEVDQNQPE